MTRSKRRGFPRAISLLPFLPLAGRAPMYARLLWALASDPRVPASRKALLGLAGAYILSPIDFVPDRVPFFGAFDDVAVMVLAIDVFLEGLPEGLVNEKLVALGIPPKELEHDLERVRRFVPRPLRQIARRFPYAIDRVGRMVGDAGLDRRAREVAMRLRPLQTEENPA
jgi:uncharacterized membrane protein YkvA (DUF1232 family)